MYLLIYRAKQVAGEDKTKEASVHNVLMFEEDKLPAMKNLAEAYNRNNNATSIASIVIVQEDSLIGFLASNRDYDLKEYSIKTQELNNSVKELQEKCNSLALCLDRKLNLNKEQDNEK